MQMVSEQAYAHLGGYSRPGWQGRNDRIRDWRELAPIFGADICISGRIRPDQASKLQSKCNGSISHQSAALCTETSIHAIQQDLGD